MLKTALGHGGFGSVLRTIGFMLNSTILLIVIGSVAGQLCAILAIAKDGNLLVSF